jgi:hypothetical protein
MSTVKTIDLKRFSNAVGFIPYYRVAWGNTRKANISQVMLRSEAATMDGDRAATQDEKAKEEKAKQRMQLKKQLIVSKEYDAIKSYIGQIRLWIYANTVPSYFKEGFQLVGLNGVERIEQYMRRVIAAPESVAPEVVTLPKLVDAFIAVYPQQIEEARKVLEPVGQFNASDYPTVEEMRRMFSITWNWVSFTVPEGLPAELRQAETEKMEKQFTDAGEQIKAALRVGFAELIKHMQERLTTAPGEKAKVFRDSAIGNIQEFIETFNQRNLLNDVELAQLVARAQEVLSGVTPQKLRQVDDVKKTVTTGLAEITGKLDAMLVDQPSRKFDLDDPEDTSAPTAIQQAIAQEPGQLALA